MTIPGDNNTASHNLQISSLNSISWRKKVLNAKFSIVNVMKFFFCFQACIPWKRHLPPPLYIPLHWAYLARCRICLCIVFFLFYFRENVWHWNLLFTLTIDIWQGSCCDTVFRINQNNFFFIHLVLLCCVICLVNK